MDKQSNTKAFQYQYEILLKSATIEYNNTFNFKIVLKRGNKQVDTKSTYKYEAGGKKEVPINEELSIISTILQKEDGKYKDKAYKFYIQVYTKQGFKSAAFSEVNFSDFINKENELDLSFEKIPFSFLRLKIIIRNKFLGEIDLKENPNDMSRMSMDGDMDDSYLNTNGKTTASYNSNSNSKYQQEINSIVDNKEKDVGYVNTLNTQRKNSFFKNTSNESSPSIATLSSCNHEQILKNNEESIKKLTKKNEAYENEKKELESNIISLESLINTLKAGSGGNSGLMEELQDKERIIGELKTENEYFSDEVTQFKSIIKDLKIEKNKLYEEKMGVIKEQKEEIEKLKNKMTNYEKEAITKGKEVADSKLKLDYNNKLVQEYKDKYNDLE